MKFLIITIRYVMIVFLLAAITVSPVDKKYKIPKKDRIDAAMKQEHMMTMDCKTGSVPRRTLLKSLSSLRIIENDNALRSSGMNLSWHERGPNNVGGRTRAILVDQADPSGQTVFAAGVSGGLWKTNNITASDPAWQNINDFFGSLSICALAQDPNNHSILYFGTGEGYFEVDAVPGMGIWKSTNGGSTWTHLSSTNNDDFKFVQKIAVADNGSVFVSTFDGVKKSINAGTSWTTVLDQSSGATTSKANDLEIASDGSIYVSMGVFSEDGIYKSQNNGSSWNKLSSGLPSNGYHRIEIALAPSDASRIYALYEDANSGQCKGIYRSSNSGASWTTVNNPSALGMSNFARSQAWYNLSVEVDPSNKDRLFIGGIDLLKSVNGGTSWTQVSQWGGLGGMQYMHADQHCIKFINSNELLIGNDGGVYYTSNATSSMPQIYPKNKGYNITQFYAATAHPDPNTDYFVAGAQDNGTQRFNSTGINETTEVSGGDGARCYIDKNNPNVQITSYVFNNYFVTINGGASYSFVSFNDHGLFANATDYDHQEQKLYAASEPGKLVRWNNPASGGSSYSNITLNGINNDQITFVRIAPQTANRLFIGTDGGDVYYVDQINNGTSKSAIKIRDDVDGFVSGIDILENNENSILISYSNYNHNSLYLTQNGGTIWNSVEGDLPDMPVRDVMFNPEDSDKAIIATELGVWVTENLNASNTNWIPNNTGLAQVRVDDLYFRDSDQLILAATHGRGLYTSMSFGGTSVSFEENQFDVMEMEMSSSTGSCSEDYYDFSIPVKITANPASTETVTIQVDYSNSDVTNARDFQLLTNAISFTPTGSMTKYVQVRLIDDAIEESAENLRLTLNPQNAEIGDNAFIDITVRDNDYDAMSGGASGMVELGNGSTAQDDFPFRGYYEDEKTQVLYKASELMGMGMQAGSISALSLNVKTKSSTGSFKGFSIKLRHTNLNDVNQPGVPFENGMTTVFSQDVQTTQGWNQFNFTNSFDWNGTDNILVEYCYNNNSWSDDDEIYSTVTPFNSVQYRYTDGNIGCNLTTVQKNSNVRPDTRFHQNSGSIDLANSLVDKNSYVAGNQTAHYYDNGKLIMSVKNLSSQSIECTEASVDRLGSGIQYPSWLSGYGVSDKTFYVDADKDVNYEVTLYYTSSELNAWTDLDALGVLKTEVAIPNYSNQGFEFVEPDNITQANLSGGVVAFTANFNGFSGFAISDYDQSVVPLELLDFRVETREQYNYLNWRVSQEYDMESYVIQRSMDGSHFEDIDALTAYNQWSAHEYEFADYEISFANLTYYRLKMIGLEGFEEYSDIKSVQRERKDQLVLKFFPNPVKDQLTILLDDENGDIELNTLEIRAMNGAVIRTYGEDISLYDSIDLKGIPEGTYVLYYTLTNGNHGVVRMSKVN